MAIEIIKNFLAQDILNSFNREIVEEASVPFFFQKTVAYGTDTNEDFYFAHSVYEDCEFRSSLRTLFFPIIEQLEVKSLIRIKINLYPRTEKLHSHNPHRDWEFEHKGCILSLNTCDGFTVIGEKKIPSIENQALLFDPSVEHNSTTCTNTQARININFNYF